MSTVKRLPRSHRRVRGRRRFYRLTSEGRAQALAVLGLKDQREAAR